MLTVYIDFKSPASYLALGPTCALAERLGIDVTWRAFRTHQRDIPEQVIDRKVALSHQRVRAQAQRATHIRYAGFQGVDLVFPAVAYETDLALGVLCEISSDPINYIRAGFSAYWDRHLDLNDERVVTGLIESSRVTHSGALSTAMTSLDVAQEKAEAGGIVDAPAYVVDQQIFIGRQHLPWIERIARSGCSVTPISAT